jgi:hypothetical protein
MKTAGGNKKDELITLQLCVMQGKRDPHLDVPAEANREKHINFLEAEERTSRENIPDNERFGTDDDQKRREEWQRGLEEGKKTKNENT